MKMKLIALVIASLSVAVGTAFGQEAPYGFDVYRYTSDFSKGVKGWQPKTKLSWKTGKADDHQMYLLDVPGTPGEKPDLVTEYSLAPGPTLSDFTFETLAQVVIDSKGKNLCIVFGYLSDSDYWYVRISGGTEQESKIALMRVKGGVATKIAEETKPARTVTVGKWHKLKVIRNNGSGWLYAYVDDLEKPVFSAMDKTYVFGRIGIGSLDSRLAIDRARITGNPVPPLE
jgi:hypothetical protein